MRYLLLAASAAIAFTSITTAQRVAAYDPTVGVINECQPAGVLLPGPVPPVLAYPQAPLLPALLPPAGDSTFDNLRAFHWVTNGAILAAQPTPMFPPAGPLPPAMPIPLPVLAAIGGGPVTGIAMDAAAGIMYLTGVPGMTIGVTPLPGMPVVVPPFALPFAAGPITGLEWDSVTGQLIAVDAAGFTYRYFPGGAPAAPPLPPPMAFGPMVTDVAIDRTLLPNAFGLRSLYVLAGPAYFDVHDPAPAPQPAGPAMGQGLAFMNHPATNKPGGPCICPSTTYPAPGSTTTGPMTAMNAGFGVTMSGLPAGFPVIFGFDIAGFLPGFPVINPPVGCGLGLTLGPSTLLFLGVANAVGVATYPVPLVPPYFFPGAPAVYNQNATVCPADPTYGLVLSPMQSIYTCVP